MRTRKKKKKNLGIGAGEVKDLGSDFMANGLGDGFAVDDLRLRRHDSHHNSLPLPLHNEVPSEDEDACYLEVGQAIYLS